MNTRQSNTAAGKLRIAASACTIAAVAAVACTLTAGEFGDSGTAHATLTVATISAHAGDMVELGIMLDADDLVGAFDFDVTADGHTIDDVVYDGPLFDAGWDGWDSAPGSNIFVSGACIFSEDQVTGEQALVSLQISIPDDVEVGSFIAVNLSDALVTNYQFTLYDVTIENGGIFIEGETPCAADIANNDGVVDADDLLLMIASWGPCVDDCSADLTDDEIVGVDDVLMLLASWGVCD